MTSDLHFRKTILPILQSMAQMPVGSSGDVGETYWKQGGWLARKAVALVQVKDDTCLKDTQAVGMDRSVQIKRHLWDRNYRTWSLPGYREWRRGRSQRQFYVSVIELKLMSFPERVAHRPWIQEGILVDNGAYWICCTYEKSNWRYILVIEI